MKNLVMSVIAIVTFSASASHAGGFIADALKGAGLINEQQRAQLDKAHEQAGKPLDKVPEEVLRRYLGK